MPPPLLRLPSEAAYRQHFIDNFCRATIMTHDNIRVHFKQGHFNHAFYHSPGKTVFALERARRMNWIIDTLTDPAASHYKGWLPKPQVQVSTRRVAILHGDFVVVIGFELDRGGNLRGYFITCFPATSRSVNRISSFPAWNLQDCLNEL